MAIANWLWPQNERPTLNEFLAQQDAELTFQRDRADQAAIDRSGIPAQLEQIEQRIYQRVLEQLPRSEDLQFVKNTFLLLNEEAKAPSRRKSAPKKHRK